MITQAADPYPLAKILIKSQRKSKLVKPKRVKLRSNNNLPRLLVSRRTFQNLPQPMRC